MLRFVVRVFSVCCLNANCAALSVNGLWFSDNIDTRTALDVLRDLLSSSNVYIRDTTQRNALLLRRIASYITDILHIFGACTGPRGGIGFPVGGQSGNEDVCEPNTN